MSRKTNQAGIELVKDFEGLHTKAYLCPANVWTIGYGHTAGVRQGQVITEAEAEQFLIDDLSSAEKAVERLITSELNDNQFAALASFTFNLGAGNLQASTLRRKLNGGDYDAVPSELARWVKAGGKTLAGLVRRRAAEGELFMKDPAADSPEERPLMPQSAALMPQRVESVDGGAQEHIMPSYLTDAVDLENGSVDEAGDERYKRLSQNVPDGYVTALQTDLRSLGYDKEVGKADGAFGNATKKAVKAFQRDARIEDHGVVDHSTRAALVEWLAHGFSQSNPPGDDGEVLTATGQDMTLITPRVPHFSQGDARWASRTLGRSSSIRRAGCAITCIAMILRHHGCNVDPLMLDAYLDANSGYVGNSVKWAVAGSYAKHHGGPALQFAQQTGKIEDLRDTLRGRIERNQPTMVRVDYGRDEDFKYDHFVVCVGHTPNGDFIMNDPATRRGDGYMSADDANIIERTSRQGGYKIVKLDYYDPA